MVYKWKCRIQQTLLWSILLEYNSGSKISKIFDRLRIGSQLAERLKRRQCVSRKIVSQSWMGKDASWNAVIHCGVKATFNNLWYICARQLFSAIAIFILCHSFDPFEFVCSDFKHGNLTHWQRSKPNKTNVNEETNKSNTISVNWNAILRVFGDLFTHHLMLLESFYSIYIFGWFVGWEKITVTTEWIGSIYLRSVK